MYLFLTESVYFLQTQSNSESESDEQYSLLAISLKVLILTICSCINYQKGKKIKKLPRKNTTEKSFDTKDVIMQ